MSDTKPPLVVKNIKAADPGVSFQVINPRIDKLEELTIVVQLTNMSSSAIFQTQISLSNPTSDEIMNFLIPFGDDAYRSGELLRFDIDINFVWENERHTNPPVRGLVLATAGQFSVGNNLTKVMKPGWATSILPNSQMLASLDDQYIGVLNANGRFKIYPQSRIGDNLSALPAEYDSVLEDDGWKGCSLIFDTDGYVKIKSVTPDYFISQQMPSGTTGLAILSNNNSPFPDPALCFTNDAGVPLEAVAFRRSTNAL